jgi:hypothetical protein
MALRNYLKRHEPIPLRDPKISDAIIGDDILKTFRDFSTNLNNAALIGDLALSYYVAPRSTYVTEFLFARDEDIPTSINGFSHPRLHAFIHNETEQRVEIFTPNVLGVPSDVILKIIGLAFWSDGVKIASPTGLVALKLHRLNMMQERADIEALIKTNQIQNLEQFGLSKENMRKYENVVERLNQ